MAGGEEVDGAAAAPRVARPRARDEVAEAGARLGPKPADERAEHRERGVALAADGTVYVFAARPRESAESMTMMTVIETMVLTIDA